MRPRKPRFGGSSSSWWTRRQASSWPTMTSMALRVGSRLDRDNLGAAARRPEVALASGRLVGFLRDRERREIRGPAGCQRHASPPSTRRGRPRSGPRPPRPIVRERRVPAPRVVGWIRRNWPLTSTDGRRVWSRVVARWSGRHRSARIAAASSARSRRGRSRSKARPSPSRSAMRSRSPASDVSTISVSCTLMFTCPR